MPSSGANGAEAEEFLQGQMGNTEWHVDKPDSDRSGIWKEANMGSLDGWDE